MGKKKDEAPGCLIAATTGEVFSGAKADEHRAALLELYVKHVLEAKQAPQEATLRGWGPLVGTFKPEDIEQFLPIASRMSKRNAIAIARAVPIMAAGLKFDVSGQS